eukprot:8541872-Lingulodinium_polyedra.AAC.1
MMLGLASDPSRALPRPFEPESNRSPAGRSWTSFRPRSLAKTATPSASAPCYGYMLIAQTH